jgi:hypothetical protein
LLQSGQGLLGLTRLNQDKKLMLRKNYFLFAGIVPENDPETSSGQDDKI